MIVDEGWRSGSISAEIMARINEQAFFELDAPMGRVCSAEVPFPYAKHLEDAALPQPVKIVAMARQIDGGSMSEFLMPSLGADMKSAILMQWKVKVGDRVTKGQVIAEIETSKGVIESRGFPGRYH
jgi:Pyruvate/2-oxoglutarate dehydrogenase complex, dehydrogenase (E1) component, eukaryotic type, beta subunit